MTAIHATAFVTEVGDEAQLDPEDRPEYSLYAADELTLTAKEGFCFSADVPAACYHFQATHLSGLAGLGVDVFVRILVKDGYDWARPWARDWTLSPLTKKAKTGTALLRLGQPAVLEVYAWQEGHNRGAKLKVSLSASVRKETIHPRRAAADPSPVAAVRLWATPAALCDPPEPLGPAAAPLLADRCGHTAAAYGDAVYVFGGEAAGSLSNDLLVVDGQGGVTKYSELLDGHVGARCCYTGVPPAPRAGHSCVVWAGKLCLFGGFGVARAAPRAASRRRLGADPAKEPDPFPTAAGPGPAGPPSTAVPGWEKEALPLLDVFLFDPKTQMWSSPSLLQNAEGREGDDSPGLARAYHTAAVYLDAMYVFGGCVDAGLARRHEPGGWVDSPAWRYTLGRRQWQALSSSNTPYDGRVYGHSAAVLQGSMYVFGGVTPKGYSDQLWCLGLQSMAWTAVVTTGPPPAPRAFATLVGLQCTRGTSANGPDVYPVTQLLEPDLGPGHSLTCCVVFGGGTRRKGAGVEAVHVLPLQDFRGNEALRWLRHPVADGTCDTPAPHTDLPTPGPGALLCLRHRPCVMFVGQPLRRTGPTSLPALSLFTGMAPRDFSAFVTQRGITSRGDPFHNPVALALSELEQQLRLLKAQMKLAAQLSLATDHPEMRQAYVFACMDLSEHVHRCEDCCQRIPPQRRGSKGDDLLAMLDTLKAAAGLMIQEAQTCALASGPAAAPGRAEALGDVYRQLRSPSPEPPPASPAVGRRPSDVVSDPTGSVPWSSPRVSPRPQSNTFHPRTVSCSTTDSGQGPWPPAEWTGGSDTGAEANVRRLAELLRAQIRCVQLLQAAGPGADHALEYAHACRALGDMVQQGAVALLELPPGGFGSATEDLAMTYDALANQAHVILADCPPDPSLLSSLPPPSPAPPVPTTGSSTTSAPTSPPGFPSPASTAGLGSSSSPSAVVLELEEALTLLDRQLIALKKQRQRARGRLLFRPDVAKAQAFLKPLVARCTELAGRVPPDDAAGQALVRAFGRLLEEVAEDLSA